MKSLACTAVLAVAVTIGFTSCSGSGSGTAEAKVPDSAPSAGATPSDPTDAIQRYVAGEDNGFGDLQGDPMKTSSGDYTYYTTTDPIPGSANCVVYVVKSAQDHFARCDFASTNLSDAKSVYQTWLKNLQSAEPYWHTVTVDPLPNDDAAASVFTDNREDHGIYVELSKAGKTGYRVSTTDAKMSALRS